MGSALSLSVLPVVYRIWASARMGQLEDWFRSWVLESVFSAGSGRSSVEAWCTSALDIEEVLSGVVDSDVHLLVADVIKSFDVRLVGQEPAPIKCVLMSTSRAVRSDMRRWVVTDDGDRWSVKLDVRDLGSILILPFVDGLRL